MRAYGVATAALAIVFVGIGIALIVETVVVGGAIGYLFGLLFVAGGVARLYVLRRSARR
ncbi:MAG: hypothetical protein ACJ747_00270 [Gaiellaceae bacterium]|nr:hypothetical protein [Acidobacteriota bacterium]